MASNQEQQLAELLRRQSELNLDIPILWQQEGESGGDAGGAGGAGGDAGGAEDLTGLKNTISALRDEVKTLKADKSTLETQLGEANNERTQLSQLNQTLTTANQGLTIDLALNTALGDVLPDKRDLLWGVARPQLGLGEDGAVKAGDRPLSDFVTELRGKYPDLFAASNVPQGAGTTTTAGATETTGGTITVAGGVIQGVNPADILSGKVSIASS